MLLLYSFHLLFYSLHFISSCFVHKQYTSIVGMGSAVSCDIPTFVSPQGSCIQTLLLVWYETFQTTTLSPLTHHPLPPPQTCKIWGPPRMSKSKASCDHKRTLTATSFQHTTDLIGVMKTWVFIKTWTIINLRCYLCEVSFGNTRTRYEGLMQTDRWPQTTQRDTARRINGQLIRERLSKMCKQGSR